MDKMSLEYINYLIDDTINYGKMSCRLPMSLELSQHARETLVQTLQNKAEDPKNKDVNDYLIIVSYLVGYAEAKYFDQR